MDEDLADHGQEKMNNDIDSYRSIVDEAEGADDQASAGTSALESLGYDVDGTGDIDGSLAETDDSAGLPITLGTVLRAGPIVVIVAIFLLFLVLETV